MSSSSISAFGADLCASAAVASDGTTIVPFPLTLESYAPSSVSLHKQFDEANRESRSASRGLTNTIARNVILDLLTFYVPVKSQSPGTAHRRLCSARVRQALSLYLQYEPVLISCRLMLLATANALHLFAGRRRFLLGPGFLLTFRIMERRFALLLSCYYIYERRG